jgi:hypothetical protein
MYKPNAMDRLRFQIALEGLDELSIENLKATPPRITRAAMHLACQQATRQLAFDTDHIGIPGRISTRSEMLIADALNDMIFAAQAIHWKENSP